MIRNAQTEIYILVKTNAGRYNVINGPSANPQKSRYLRISFAVHAIRTNLVPLES